MSCETSSASSMVASLLLRSSFAHPAACPYDARHAALRPAAAGVYSRAAGGLARNLSGGSPAPLRTSKNPAIAGGVSRLLQEAESSRSRSSSVEDSSSRDAGLVVGRLAQHVTAAPHRLDVVLAVRRIGQLLAQLADEHVDDLELGLVHAAVDG